MDLCTESAWVLVMLYFVHLFFLYCLLSLGLIPVFCNFDMNV